MLFILALKNSPKEWIQHYLFIDLHIEKNMRDLMTLFYRQRTNMYFKAGC